MLIVLIVSSLWTSGVWATDLNTHQGYHNVCDWHCVIQDASTIVKKFEMEVAKEETRAVKLPISSQLYSKNDICQNTSYEDISSSFLMWAASEKEPYLYIPSNFFRFSGLFSLHSRQETKIHMNCTREEQRVPLNEHNGTSLSNAVMKSVRQELMRTTGGTLCYHYNEYVFTRPKNAYKCCQFDMSISGITCNVVYPPVKYVDWFQAVQIIWLVLAGMIFLYLPAVICLFPVGRKFSKDGTACIELGDPSPTGFRMLVSKFFFVPETIQSWKDGAKFMFLRVVFLIITGVPLITAYVLSVLNLPTIVNFIGAICGSVLGLLYLIKSIHSAFLSETVQQPGIRKILRAYLSERDAKTMSTSSKFHKVKWYVRPIMATFKSEMNCKNYKSSIDKLKSLRLCMYSIVSFLSFVFIFMWLLANVAICAILLPYSIMAVIDYEQDVLPRLSLALLILYYFHIYFTKFSEKYQLLKLDLYEGIKCKENKKGESKLVLSTEPEGKVAIPEELYEAACEELQMCMITDALWAFLKFMFLSTFVFSFFCSVMIFGDRLGSGNLTSVVATFLAGFLPTLFTLFSSSDGSQTLKNIEKERRLKNVITKYTEAELEQNFDKSMCTAISLSSLPSGPSGIIDQNVITKCTKGKLEQTSDKNAWT